METLTKKLSILKFLIILFFCTLAAGKLIAQINNNALEFIENKGQWEKEVQYKGVLSNGAFFLRNTGFTVLQYNADDLHKLAEIVHGHADAPVKETPGDPRARTATADQKPGTEPALDIHSHAYNMDFVGGNKNAFIVADKPQPGYNNYFIGNDSSKWVGNCKLFQVVTYKNVYPGIDVKYYSEGGNLKYEFIVNPGANPSNIVMKFDGVDRLSVKNNELVLQTSVGDIKELVPFTYQYQGTERKNIDCRYQLSGNEVRFAIRNFSGSTPLIIDPTLIFASFTGSTADNWGYTATYGSDGSVYAGGIVFDNGFPTSPGAFQVRYSAASGPSFWNMGIIKLNPSGTQRVYATYLGGNAKDQPHSLYCDPQGNLVIAGRTSSSNYPSTANFGTLGGWDIVVTKLNATGSAILGSVRIGGKGDDGFNTADSHTGRTQELLFNYGDDARSEVILDGSNNIYLASCTQSADFYLTPNAVQRTLQGAQDGVLIKINPACTSVTYSSYLGGSGYDACFVLALNPANGDIYTAGGTTSTDFPGNKAGSYQSAFSGGRTDGFISVFSNDGSVLKQTTYLGTSGVDVIFGIQFDRNDYPYVMGITTGTWPVINAAYNNPKSKQFISKLKKDLSGFVYSTVFGTGSTDPNISPVAFLVDRCENVYVSGWGKDFLGSYQTSPVAGMPVTADAIKGTPDATDFYFIVLQRDASKLLYGTFFGQNNGLGEHVDGGTSRFDQNGVIYQAICANCASGGQSGKPRWPVTPGAWCCATGLAPATGGGQCNLAAVKIAFNFAGVGVGVRAYVNSVFDTSGCVPLAVTFRDTVRNAQHYEWDFGDGSTLVKTDSFEIQHVYNNVGTYRVMLVAIDSATCNIRDTSYISVIVRNDIANLNFTATKLPPCQSLTYRFDNLSTPPPGKPFSSQAFTWDFGDGTPRITSSAGSITHTFNAPGTFKVKLIMSDTNYCNGPDSLTLPGDLRISPLVKAQFEIPATGCAPYTAVFKNTSLAGQSFFWDFGDGATSTAINPTHEYTQSGVFVIKLKAYDSATCNLVDSAQLTLTINAKPTAAFTVNPSVPAENIVHTFTNNSSENAVRFKWIFGDGDTLMTTSRSTVDHQYNATNTYNACLVAFNQLGCSDTACTTVKTIVTPKLDLPNAFTPQGPASANKIYVRGFAIGKMRFSIYNRLGQKVFETNDVSEGWDGKFKGVIQPMDVYAYILDVEFTDGTKTTKKGDITLIR